MFYIYRAFADFNIKLGNFFNRIAEVGIRGMKREIAKRKERMTLK